MGYAQPSGSAGKTGWYRRNTNLDPEIDNALELGYQFYTPKNKI